MSIDSVECVGKHIIFIGNHTAMSSIKVITSHYELLLVIVREFRNYRPKFRQSAKMVVALSVFGINGGCLKVDLSAFE